MAGDQDNENPWTDKTAAKFNKYAILSLPGPTARDYASPTLPYPTEAATRSIRCLHRNGGDRDLCSDYFQYVALDSQSSPSSVNRIPRAMIQY
ncbi:hypothetical protein IWX90DRAFT_482242 [Phyllosticta citrichinensis]|uniref:Uncharacterized protein n=1 Tax=Phyllosticta citrichinensis TaxID=1130410 RepID=A0ABR1Y713_9PEZI